MLLRTTVPGACDYCHVNGPFATTVIVYGGDPLNYGRQTGYEHTLDATIVPDSADATGVCDPANDYVIAPLTCLSCHSVHGANVVGAGTNLLRVDPNPLRAGIASDDTGFCADCHSNNMMRIKDRAPTDTASHYMGASTDATIATLGSTDCWDCHSGGDGSSVNSYPHYTTGMYFLKDSLVETQGTVLTDGVCLDCHQNAGVKF